MQSISAKLGNLQHPQNEGVSEVTMIGKVTKEILYKGGILIPDWQAVKLLMSLPDRHDDTIMNALVAKLEEMGIHVMDQTLFLKHIMPEEGVLSRRKPTDKEWEDMKYGFRMAKRLAVLILVKRSSSRTWPLWPWKPSKVPMPASSAAAAWAGGHCRKDGQTGPGPSL